MSAAGIDNLFSSSVEIRNSLRYFVFFFVLSAMTILAMPEIAHPDDCIAVEEPGDESDSDPDPDEEDPPPDFIDFNLCEGAHALNPSGDFFLAVHAAAPDGNYETHETWLLESNDAASWSIVPGFEEFLGSVPEVITRGSEILFFNPGKMRAYDIHSGEVRGASVIITDAEGETVNYVDPSTILDDQGRIVMFFLNSTGTPMGQDPAAGSDPKDFDSAVEVEGSAGTQFILTEGHRVQVQGSDPDIFFDGAQFVLYISRGQSTLAFVSDTLEGDYLPVTELGEDPLLTREGGIPAGHYDEETGSYWTYIHAHSAQGTIVRFAEHDSLAHELQGTDFQTVVSGEGLGYPTGYRAESPSFAINALVPEPGANLAGLAVLLALASYSQVHRKRGR